MPASPPPSPSAIPAVRVRGLAKRYGAVEALRDVSFDVAPGEIFGLLGPNGAGKTTALECLLGLRRADAGSIMLGGIDALAEPERAKELVGAQLQEAALQDKITPREALALFASFYRAPLAVGVLLERFALGDKADAPFDSLSGGQRQRLFLALAFVNDPRLVVLDEPTAGLDPQARRELHAMIAGWREAGRAVLLSTHYIEEAHQLCDRVGILDRGRLVAVARPDELIARSRATPRLRIVTAPALDAPTVWALAGVVASERDGGAWVLGTGDVNRTLHAVVKAAEAAGAELRDVQIRRPTLEDVCLELTGRAWAEPAAATGNPKS